jgi:hypothetical protein
VGGNAFGEGSSLMFEDEHVKGNGIEKGKEEENVFGKAWEIFVWFVTYKDFFEHLVIFSGLAFEIFKDVGWIIGEKRGFGKD